MAGALRNAYLAGFAALLLALGAAARAEPYISVRTGNPCNACHVNGSGGGMRTVFGSTYARNVLSVRLLSDKFVEPEIGIAEGLRLGGDARYSGRQHDPRNADDSFEFQTDRTTLYGDLKLNQLIDLYTDQQVAPGGGLNRESWARLSWEQWYLKGGKFYQPYGWSLEDDTALVRQATGTNFATSDNGLEAGYLGPRLQVHVAVTNGSGGGSENNDGKFVVARGNWIGSLGQVGINAGFNDGGPANRTLLGMTGGCNTGPLTWLLEYDYVKDDADAGEGEKQNLGLLEANWLIARGHNLKLTAEMQDFDGGGKVERGSIVWEYFPWSHTQLRTGFRREEAHDLPFTEGDEYFVQAHIYF